MKKNSMKRPAIMRAGLIILVIPLLLSCKNPFKSEEPKKQRIIILMNNEYLAEPGRYVAYWNGKDEKGNYIKTGNYIILIEAKDFSDQTTITALEGGKPDDNNNQHIEPGYWTRYELEKPYPNPFHILSGVNIPFLVPDAGRVKITIFKD
jgi:hypothetical protein